MNEKEDIVDVDSDLESLPGLGPATRKKLMVGLAQAFQAAVEVQDVDVQARRGGDLAGQRHAHPVAAALRGRAAPAVIHEHTTDRLGGNRHELHTVLDRGAFPRQQP